MTQTQIPQGEVGKHADSNVSVLDLLLVLARRKKMIIGLPLAAGVISAALSFALPNVYRSSAKLLPPQQQQSSASALLAQFGGAASIAAGVGALKNPSDLYVGMLKSRTVADRLIQQYDLKKAYDTDSLEAARRQLAADTIITAGKDGLITIEVESENKKGVADLTNSYVQELLRLTHVLAVTEASQRRVFFEHQLKAAKDNLAKAEISMKRALDSRGVISVDNESRAIVETVARLRAQASAKEVQLNALRAFVTENHRDFLQAEEELKSLRAELSRLENGRSGEGVAAAGGSTPAGLENIKILRDVKYHQMLYELLSKQYEVARLDEAKDPSIIQVLDPAIAPERKFKPKRSIIVLTATLFALVAAVAWAFIADIRKRALSSPATAARWAELNSHLRMK